MLFEVFERMLERVIHYVLKLCLLLLSERAFGRECCRSPLATRRGPTLRSAFSIIAKRVGHRADGAML